MFFTTVILPTQINQKSGKLFRKEKENMYEIQKKRN